MGKAKTQILATKEEEEEEEERIRQAKEVTGPRDSPHLRRHAEDTRSFRTLWRVTRHYVITYSVTRDALSNCLDDRSSLVAKN